MTGFSTGKKVHFESEQFAKLKKKWSLKAGRRPTTDGFTCVTCGRIFASWIGLYSHRQTHPHPWPERSVVLTAQSVHQSKCLLTM